MRKRWNNQTPLFPLSPSRPVLKRSSLQVSLEAEVQLIDCGNLSHPLLTASGTIESLLRWGCWDRIWLYPPLGYTVTQCQGHSPIMHSLLFPNHMDALYTVLQGLSKTQIEAGVYLSVKVDVCVQTHTHTHTNRLERQVNLIDHCWVFPLFCVGNPTSSFRCGKYKTPVLLGNWRSSCNCSSLTVFYNEGTVIPNPSV
jgi:hypothetical protein